VTNDGEGPHRGPGLGGAVSAAIPRILARTLGPVLRTGRGDSAFLNRLNRTHTESMLELSTAHWDALIRVLGVEDFQAILDIGCGSGAWLAPLARVNDRVVGIDIDGEVLDIARKRSSDAGNVEVRKMPAEQLDFPNDSFNAVTCLTVLPYVNQPVAIAEMARVLRQNGKLVLGTVGFGYYAKHVAEGIRHERLDAIRYGVDPILVAAGRAIAGNRVAPASVRSWSPRAVRQLIESHGFGVDRVFRNVDAADPSWPESYLARPVYFMTVATKRR
jgi:ubiquinone/menaquinone biosynthesis C-methylase UbiE